jgi:hypothetical protein
MPTAIVDGIRYQPTFTINRAAFGAAPHCEYAFSFLRRVHTQGGCLSARSRSSKAVCILFS